MIPTYNRIEFLGKTIRSVLDQDLGSELMQIEVIDNCSPDYNVAAFVKEIAGNRVTYFRQETTVDFQENWNTCIRRSRGKWVHILHDDDMVLPGFYETYKKFIEDHPEIGLVFCQSVNINEKDEQIRIYIPPIPYNKDGILNEPIPLLIADNFIPSTSAVVSRKIYEKIGGFHPHIMHTIDWDMWIRISKESSIGYIYKPLLAYRVHSQSGSNLQDYTIEQIDKKYEDIIFIIETYGELLPRKTRNKTVKKFKKRFSLGADIRKKVQIREKKFLVATYHAKWAWKIYPSVLNFLKYSLFRLRYRKFILKNTKV